MTLLSELTISQNIGDLIIFGMLVVSGYVYLFFWRTEKKVKKDVITFEFDVLLLSMVFSSIFVLITIGLFIVANTLTGNTIANGLISGGEGIISFNFLLNEYFIVFIFVLFMNFPKIRRLINSFSYKIYDKKMGMEGLLIAIVILGPISLYFGKLNYLTSIVALAIFYCFVFCPSMLIIEITKRLFDKKSLV